MIQIRHNPDLIPFCLYVRNLGGKQLYMFLAGVLHLPEIDTVERARREVSGVDIGWNESVLNLSVGVIVEVRFILLLLIT